MDPSAASRLAPAPFAHELFRSGRLIGATVAIYDPERDPERRYAAPLASVVAGAFS